MSSPKYDVFNESTSTASSNVTYCITNKEIQSYVNEIAKPSFTILVVDDNVFNQQYISELLLTLGYLSSTADNGKVALELVQHHCFDLILMDCQMPEMDGYSATQHIREWQIRQNKPHTPIVAVTASDDRKKCFTAGMDDFLGKPFYPKELKGMLEKWLTH